MDSYILTKFYVDSKKVSEEFLHHHYPVLINHPSQESIGLSSVEFGQCWIIE
jgi:hypothetical protein